MELHAGGWRTGGAGPELSATICVLRSWRGGTSACGPLCVGPLGDFSPTPSAADCPRSSRNFFTGCDTVLFLWPCGVTFNIYASGSVSFIDMVAGNMYCESADARKDLCRVYHATDVSSNAPLRHLIRYGSRRVFPTSSAGCFLRSSCNVKLGGKSHNLL